MARPGKGSSRARVVLIVVVAAVVLLLTSVTALATFYTNYLWFQSVHLVSVWRGVTGAKVTLGATFSLVFFAALLASLTIADRARPSLGLMGPEDELVARYRDTIGPHASKVRLVLSVIFALLVGTGTSSQWRHWILFNNAVSFHAKDPQFHMDIGFFVFRLPFLSFLAGWAFVALIVISVLTALSFYLNGGIRLQGPGPRVAAKVKAHLSVLLSLIALVKAAGYWLSRYQLDFSTRGVAEGASYTAVKIQIPALTLLMLISLVAFGLFLVNIRRQGWALPVLGVGLWAFLALVVGVIIPAAVQKFKVQPAQETLESPYIARDITATRAAYGIDHVKTTQYNYGTNLTPAVLRSNSRTLSNIPLWDPRFAMQTFQQLQGLRSYYQFNTLALDRYHLNNHLTPAIVAFRQLNSSNLPSSSWVSEHLVYTHGYGAVLAPANQASSSGNPNFMIKNIPPSSVAAPTISQPDVYYGTSLPGYVVVDTHQQELDYQGPHGTNHYSTYAGSGGVPIGSVIPKAAFALRFGDINLFVSSLLSSHSRIMFMRNITDRVRMAAPFLRYGSHPYPVIANHKLYWVINAYTTTNHYPYSQQASVNQLSPTSGLKVPLNYVRNSVRVVINAYSGNMHFYVTNPTDPIIQAYQKAFPKLFTPGSQMSSALQRHLRYPEDMFLLQSQMFGRYHITSPRGFYSEASAWQLSQDAGSGSPSAALKRTPTTDAQGFQIGSQVTRMRPVYQLMRLPGAKHQSFVTLEAFTPVARGTQQQNLTAFMVANNGPSHYGRLTAYVTPPGQLIDGPVLVDSRTLGAPQISKEISLLNVQGSQVELGNVLTIPIHNSLLYVRALYTSSTRNPLPEFRKVMVVYGRSVAMQDSLSAALSSIFGTSSPSISQQSSTGPPVAVTPNVAALIARANQTYAAGQSALKAGNLGLYQQDMTSVGSLLSQAAAASSGTVPGGTSAKAGTTSPATTKAAPSRAKGGTATTSATSGSSSSA